MVRVAVVMGSISDWSTMKETVAVLQTFDVAVETHIISAHRMPEEMTTFARNARDNGLGVIIAGAGGAAHLPGMLAAQTTLPVIGVPIQSHALQGMDSLLSIVQMPAGVPVATVSIGTAGAKNAAYLAMQMLGIAEQELADKIALFREGQRQQSIESEALLHD
ncbi:5-(carboxyamino)imidazole ribonucleotide mutase [Weissella cibaria]|uniref:5-(carboxyamino)imidazole ribonucleotide mutase n=1 Tax=Weissella cibaria TaxID=137591 RepID=UPI000E51E585|nr:5-(carboxyamino)imidazole ribonucleotide mutase [Weissella cibaria]RHE71493.1 5-(carboxyamino)imidazole ribonucleotide mutase [Weissella cibaria]RHE77632.1 5-(carboxyamino)imidazole ribonucleotide mutase [Weissella cibaria]